MKLRNGMRRARATIGVGVLMAGILVGALPLGTAGAVSGCRSDPTVVLSNLDVLDLSASIADSSSDVQSITYTIHAPAGTGEVLVVDTTGLLGYHEHVQFYADNSPGAYRIDTVVVTTAHGVSVTANTILVSPLGLALGSGAASGTAGQDLLVQFG